MIDEGEDVSARGAGDAAAVGMAVAATPSAEDAREYLRKQSRLADLQIENLRKVDEYETSHLRWRRFNDQMKGAMQIIVVLIGTVLVFGIGAAMWNASKAEGLVVDSFAVPSGYTQAGVTGGVIADDMTQKIAAIRDYANENSLAHSREVHEAREDVKVEIPETGISISEAWRYLRLWLGNEQHLNGNLRNLPDGRLALTVSLGGSDTFTFFGTAGDLDNLEQRAAERVFETVEPVNYVIYLEAKGRNAETLEWAARDLSLWTDNRNLAEAYSLDADMIHTITGDVRRALAITNAGIVLDPKSTPPHMESLQASRDLGHDEEVLVQARAIAGLLQEDNVDSWRTGPGFPWVQQLGAISRAGETGDFAALSVLPCAVYCSLASSQLLHGEAAARLHDAKQATRLIAQAQSLGTSGAGEIGWNPYANLAMTEYFAHAATDNWRAAVNDANRAADGIMADKSYGAPTERLRVQIQVIPLLAHALAASADVADARKAINGTPLDCYACLRERGNVESLAKNWPDAAMWYARAVAAAPSIPFAYADWGEMLLRKGDYDAAIAKFEMAHAKGPHFADPLEMWGEALMQQNRSDLALARFEEANKYAPNWGRLHLKWGEALMYAGRHEDAQKHFAIASLLDLSAPEAMALKQLTGKHS